MRRGGRGGRGGGGAGRRKPQSGKQKKQYLKAKKAEREARREREERLDEEEAFEEGDGNTEVVEEVERKKKTVKDLKVFRTGKGGELNSMFVKVADEQVQKNKEESTKPIGKRVRFLHAARGIDLGFPKRPEWDTSMSPAELDAAERKHFEEWLQQLETKLDLNQVSPFELNLQVWRQLWRTFEKSDVVLLVTDVRNPLLHIPRALYVHLLDELGIPVVICLNKADLVSEEHTNRWKEFLAKEFPKAALVTFSTKAKGTEGKGWDCKGGVSLRRKIIASKATNADLKAVHERSEEILRVCLACAKVNDQQLPTIGILGQPNVGKSSVVNALIGEKKVSVSRTCGHTKHWQTHILEKDGQAVAQLCDSPGLVFPMAWNMDDFPSAPRHVFECNGLYPIPQIRETFSAVRFIAQHVPLELLYNLKLDEESYDPEWSPYSICGSFAEKKGYSIEGGGPDFHRAGLEIIRDTVDGFILLAFLPPLDNKNETDKDDKKDLENNEYESNNEDNDNEDEQDEPTQIEEQGVDDIEQ